MKRVLMMTSSAFWRRSRGDEQRISEMLKALGPQAAVSVIYLGVGNSPQLRDTIKRAYPVAEVYLFSLLALGAGGFWRFVLFKLKQWLQPDRSRALRRRDLKQYENEFFRRYVHQVIRQVKPDAVIIEYITLAYTLEGIAKPPLTIIDTHDVMYLREQKFEAAGHRHRLSITREEEAKVLSQFDVVVAIQKNEERVLRDMLPEKVKVITVGHSHEVSSEPLDLKAATGIGYIGSGGPANVEAITSFLKNVWPNLSREWKAAHPLLIAGSVVDELPESATSPALDPTVQLLGRIDDLDVFYRQCRVVINPVSFGAGLKIKNVEALCRGIPLLTTPVGAEGLEDGAGRAFIVCQSADDYIDQLREITPDVERCSKLSEAAIDYAREKFNMDAVYGPLMDLVGQGR